MATSIFTSVSVTRGHPDKICDQIADRLLDAILCQDPGAHVACEVTVCTDQVHIFGEISTTAEVNYEEITRQVISEIGYTQSGRGFDAESCHIQVDLHHQSEDIAKGINRRGGGQDRLNAGAGDQGIMFGFTCDQTNALMPIPIELSHMLVRRLEQVRRSGELPFLLPDGKSQVSVQYEDGRPVRLSSIVIAAQHEDSVDIQDLRESIISHVIRPTLPFDMIDDDTHIFINPTGRFVQGGPGADSGLTGRKLMVDTYGGYARHGGGSFSGKDASKVDRSGAYFARYIAKNIVAQGLATQCEIELSYAIGLADPMSIKIDTYGTGKIPDDALCKVLMKRIDPRPAAIIEKFDLTKPIFSRVACYGHFGCNASNMPWEQLDMEPLL